ncbi:glycoside hydrolase [Gloeophyllum trabeum ATCC 11539]|uniref:Glycoside hydrolase n=1 Tax=Gloeophyllum trabeum (strain ATCC 11539 / FP-39264 / Madison 617) TaxID=670483 RepID=S7RRP0_GLOTA|nr:glycoside hydrolase [Gloeophyllum trabeum ATCC 11539]EPQ55644.1 glycoside hydrolase [Gloeophyllum trabeum ATCC 11539]
MRGTCALLGWLALASPIAGQQIWDVFTTKWDRTSLFTYSQPSPVINFGTPGATGQADIVVDDAKTYQTVIGFGATLTDSSALLLSQLKSKNANQYWSLLNYLFDPTDGNHNAGFTFLRVPLGASDFSASVYSFDDTSGDTALNNFNINNAPSYLFSTIQDIMSVNSILKIQILPWSPPGWMKSGGTMKGGTLNTNYINTYANYLLKCLQGFQSKGIPLYAISIQNEPENSDATYPSTKMPVSTEAAVGAALRTLMDNNGFGGVEIVGYEHNWDDAGGYPVQLMQQAAGAFSGVSFHCYGGQVSDQDTFHSQYPSKEVYFTECAGTIGSDWWSDIKWYMDNIMTGAITHHAKTGAMWCWALDGSGNPKLPGTDSCGGAGCRGVVTIDTGKGTWSVNQEFYAMAQASRAVIPKDTGGPFAKMISASVGGDMAWGLVVGAYQTARKNAADWDRYSLVVTNWADNTNGQWNPQPITATIEFRGKQATYTFPVGVTTLWWFAESTGSARGDGQGGVYGNSTFVVQGGVL